MSALSIDKVFSIHDDALKVRARRMDLLASNIANADTPFYKARDLDFGAAMRQAQQQDQTISLQTTNSKHITAFGLSQVDDVRYRIPLQASMDGNTVDAHVEKAEFAENAMRYESSLMFLNRKINSLRSVLKGE